MVLRCSERIKERRFLLYDFFGFLAGHLNIKTLVVQRCDLVIDERLLSKFINPNNYVLCDPHIRSIFVTLRVYIA
ncbi:hypothetical protein BV97_05663 [Novosphingobium resinovorum]|uniref:Uncharacterized protein n=1 Tax=Novosphingobium resinovorum TaxID=158500 RepID=A0A031J414_9SPHN|nr:hypothetical protein BV97_05663 [Novosphingobium resinovorum]